MNIFWLSPDLEEACRFHVNSHVVKMPVEHCQLLSSAIRLSTTTDYPRTEVYAMTHKNHPCAVWARESIENWKLLQEFSVLLCEEYTHRYRRQHRTEPIIKNLPVPPLKKRGVTPFPLAMPDDAKCDDPYESYRNLYYLHKRHLFFWKRRPRPDWTMYSLSLQLRKVAPKFNRDLSK